MSEGRRGTGIKWGRGKEGEGEGEGEEEGRWRGRESERGRGRGRGRGEEGGGGEANYIFLSLFFMQGGGEVGVHVYVINNLLLYRSILLQ